MLPTTILYMSGVASNRRGQSARGRSVTRVPRTFRDSESEEDLSSWIADDICTRCGAHAPHGKLYCSTRCWDEDAHAAQASKLKGKPSPARSLDQLRYPMSISPHSGDVVRRMSSLALCKSVPSDAPVRRVESPVYDEEISAHRPHHVRHNSTSSLSSSDENEHETTTPSPWHTGIDMDDEDLHKLDDAELELPPSVAASNHVLLRKGATCMGAQAPGAPSHSPSLAPHRVRFGNEIQFSRRPGSTSMPSPVVFTPLGMERSQSAGAVSDAEPAPSRASADVQARWKSWKQTHVAGSGAGASSQTSDAGSASPLAVPVRMRHCSPDLHSRRAARQPRGRGLERTGNACLVRDRHSPQATLSISPIRGRF